MSKKLLRIGAQVRILRSESLNYLQTGIVTAHTPSGRVQVRAQVDDNLDLFLPSEVSVIRNPR